MVTMTVTCLLLHAGTFSGLMQTAITTPTELLKIRLQLQTQLPGQPGYVGPIRLLKQVSQREGISGALLGRGAGGCGCTGGAGAVGRWGGGAVGTGGGAVGTSGGCGYRGGGAVGKRGGGLWVHPGRAGRGGGCVVRKLPYSFPPVRDTKQLVLINWGFGYHTLFKIRLAPGQLAMVSQA